MLIFLAFDIKRNILKTPEQTIKLFSLQNYDCRKSDPGKRSKAASPIASQLPKTARILLSAFSCVHFSFQGSSK